MKQKIMPFTLPNLFLERIHKDPKDLRNEFWFIFKDSKLLVDQDSMQPFQTKNLALKHVLYMGTFKEFHIHIGEIVCSELPPGTIFQDLRRLYGKIDDDLFAL